ncbi:MAG: iron-sulfur cluster assembly scaffold protein [Desulforegulaceae bacterium]|nr:iron-sulfur cluster assembly scaffold protein [Desulforegulaceae bacterium]
MHGIEEGFFEKHSKKFLEMAFSTDRAEYVENPDGFGSKTGECGDTISMYLTISEEKIKFLSYQIDGCINTNACSAALSKLVEGKDFDEAWETTPEDLVEYLETLPEDETHCAELAVGAFFLALSDAGKKCVKTV